MLENFYVGKYKFYLAITVTLFVVMGLIAFVFPGFTKGIDLSGGTIFIVRTDKAIDAKTLSDALSAQFDLTDLSVASISSPTGYGVTIRFAENKVLSSAQAEIELAKSLRDTNPDSAATHAQNALKILEKFIVPKTPSSNPKELLNQADLALIEAKETINNKIQQTVIQKFGLGNNAAFQIKEVSPTLGASFWQTAIIIIIIVLVLVILVVFFFFREIIPSLVVFSCGLFDIIFCLGLMALTGIPLGLNTIPALLMLFGYSIDTDIMLASRILKRKEKTAGHRASDSMLTGFTMTGTTIAAVIVMVALSYFYQVETIFDIGSVLLFGLIGDLVGTWLWSAPVILLYSEMKQKRHDKKMLGR